MIDFRAHFHDAMGIELHPDSGFYKPSAAFEIVYNLSDIATYYKFPARTVVGETGSLSFFFERHVIQNYSRPVFDCYENPWECDFRIEKISTLHPAIINSMKRDWIDLTALNPETKKIDVDMDDPLILFDALEGVACLFNTDDISFFITRQKQTQSMNIFESSMALPNYAALYNEICGLVNVNRLEWVPSFETMEQIKEKLYHRIRKDEGPQNHPFP